MTHRQPSALGHSLPSSTLVLIQYVVSCYCLDAYTYISLTILTIPYISTGTCTWLSKTTLKGPIPLPLDSQFLYTALRAPPSPTSSQGQWQQHYLQWVDCHSTTSMVNTLMLYFPTCMHEHDQPLIHCLYMPSPNSLCKNWSGMWINNNHGGELCLTTNGIMNILTIFPPL